MDQEHKDKELFDRIAEEYSRKDTYPVSQYARRFQILSLLRLLKRDQFQHILDIGCGPGFNARYLADRYSDYTGIDYSEGFIKVAETMHPGKRFIQCNIKEADKKLGKSYDLILGVGILHHIDNPEEALRSIRNLCGKETSLAFVEPYNGNPLIQTLRWLRKRFDSSYSDDQVFFSRKELVDIFKKNGYKVRKVRFQGYLSTPFAQVILKPAWLFYPLCIVSVGIDKFIQKYLNNRLSWNIQIIASADNAEKESL